jgi:hypothetical protein
VSLHHAFILNSSPNGRVEALMTYLERYCICDAICQVFGDKLHLYHVFGDMSHLCDSLGVGWVHLGTCWPPCILSICVFSPICYSLKSIAFIITTPTVSACQCQSTRASVLNWSGNVSLAKCNC